MAAWSSEIGGLGSTVSSSIGVLHLPPQPPFPEELRGKVAVHLAIADPAGAAAAAPLLEAMRAAAPPVSDTWGPTDAAGLAPAGADAGVASAPAAAIARSVSSIFARCAGSLSTCNAECACAGVSTTGAAGFAGAGAGAAAAGAAAAGAGHSAHATISATSNCKKDRGFGGAGVLGMNGRVVLR